MEDRRRAGLKKARKAAAKAHHAAVQEEYADLLPTMKQLREDGLSLQAIADQLNEQGHVTRRGKPWNRMQVSRVLERAD
jgi:hypothetical protein